MRKIPPFLLLDAWRGLAALWVVMVHSCLAFLVTGDNMRFSTNPFYAFSLWGRLGVVIFFVISGYCIMGAAYGSLVSGRTSAHFALDRIRRIYPPYLAACFLCVALSFAVVLGQKLHVMPAANHQLGAQPLGFWLSNLLLVQTEYDHSSLLIVAWSLCYEIVFYLLLGILLLIARLCTRGPDDTRGLQVFQIGVTGVTLSTLAWLIVSPATCPFPLDCWYQFGLGAMLFLVYATQPHVPKWLARAPLVVAGALTLWVACRPPGEVASFGHPASNVQALASVIFVVVLCCLRPLDKVLSHLSALRPLMWLGTFSYSLYLVHPLFIPFIDAGGRRLGLDQDRYWVTYFLQIAVALSAGWLFYFLVERHFITSRQKKRVEVELGKEEPLLAGSLPIQQAPGKR
jgi:exopolysaccharide production protein ExoZ